MDQYSGQNDVDLGAKHDNQRSEMEKIEHSYVVLFLPKHCLSRSLQKPKLLNLISSHQNVTSEFGVRVRDKSAVVMSLRLSFPCLLDKKL